MNKLVILILVSLLAIMGCQQKDSSIVKQDKSVENKCKTDLKTCPNGRTVSRNVLKNCEFDPCRKSKTNKNIKIKPMVCSDDVQECHDGSFVGRDPYNKCKFSLCPPDKNGRSINKDN